MMPLYERETPHGKVRASIKLDIHTDWTPNELERIAKEYGSVLDSEPLREVEGKRIEPTYPLVRHVNVRRIYPSRPQNESPFTYFVTDYGPTEETKHWRAPDLEEKIHMEYNFVEDQIELVEIKLPPTKERK